MSLKKLFFITLLVLLIIEVFSLFGYKYSLINTVVFFVIAILAFLISLRYPLTGFCVLAAEIVIGSFGYLFYLPIHDYRISVRIAIFIAVFLAWLIRRLKYRSAYITKNLLFKPWVALGVIIAFGAMYGLIRGNGLAAVFFDVNGYLFFLLFMVISDVLFSKTDIHKLITVIGAACTWLIIKTYLALIFFSHVTDESLIRFIYRWIRVTRIGEVTTMVGSFSRIFFQSHLWVLFLLVISGFLIIGLVYKNKLRTSRAVLLISVLCSMSVVLLSYSRSFWLGLALGLTTAIIGLVVKKLLSMKQAFMIFISTLVLIIFSLGINAFLIYIPLPGLSGQLINTGDLLVDRVITLDEPAASSRFALLEPLSKKVLSHPIIGSGYGTSVTYQSSDPRTQDINNGQYTTYSFEWGYLDILTEVGLLGLMVFGYFMYRLVQYGLTILRGNLDPVERWFIIGLLSCLLILVCIHLSTPYLNHPLGIFYIILCAHIFSIVSRSQDENSIKQGLKKA